MKCIKCGTETEKEYTKSWVCQDLECRAWNPLEVETEEVKEEKKGKKWLN